MLACARPVFSRHAAWRSLTVLLAVALLPAPVAAQAQWMPNGLPVCVLPECGGRLPMICSDGSGGPLIAWQTDRDGNEDIYIRRVLSGGVLAPGWPSIGTPATRALNDQYVSDLVADGGGGAFLVWYDFPNYDIYSQHVLGNGTIAPGWPAEGLPVSVAPGQQLDPRALPDGAGGAFIVWQDGSGISAGDIRAQHLNGDGTLVPGWPAGGLGVCTAPGVQVGPHLGSDSHGGIYVAWDDGRNCSNNCGEIFAQRLSWSGEVAAGWPADGRQIISGSGGRGIWGVIPDGAGGAYIGWDWGLDPSEGDVYAVRILADGSTAPGWPAGGYPVCALPNAQFLSCVVPDGAGGLLLAWYDHRTYPAVAYAQRVRPDGSLAPGWQPNGNPVSDLPGYHFAPRAAPDGHGGLYVAFQEAFNATGHTQRITGAGAYAPGWPSSAVPLVNDPTNTYEQSEMQITPDGVGGAIVVWNDARNGRQDQIYAQRYFGDGPTPVLVTLVSAKALLDRVTLAWLDPSRTIAGATVSRHREGEEWTALGYASFDGTGRLSYEDRDVAPGARYAYRLGWLESGVEQLSTETWVDVPVALTLALEGARPNPAVGPLSVAFTLPRAEPATLELLDVAGRQVQTREVGDLGAGAHVTRLGECGCTPPGMYWLRLAQAGRSLIKRVAVVK